MCDRFLYKISLNDDVEGRKKRKFVQKLQVCDIFLYKISLNDDVEGKKKREFVQKQLVCDRFLYKINSGMLVVQLMETYFGNLSIV